VTRRKTNAFADPKVSELVVNMDRLEEEVAPHALGVDVALAAFGVGKGSAKMSDEEVRKIEIAYPQAFCRAAKAGGARVCGVMTAVGAEKGAAARRSSGCNAKAPVSCHRHQHRETICMADIEHLPQQPSDKTARAFATTSAAVCARRFHGKGLCRCRPSMGVPNPPNSAAQRPAARAPSAARVYFWYRSPWTITTS